HAVFHQRLPGEPELSPNGLLALPDQADSAGVSAPLGIGDRDGHPAVRAGPCPTRDPAMGKVHALAIGADDIRFCVSSRLPLSCGHWGAQWQPLGDSSDCPILCPAAMALPTGCPAYGKVR